MKNSTHLRSQNNQAIIKRFSFRPSLWSSCLSSRRPTSSSPWVLSWQSECSMCPAWASAFWLRTASRFSPRRGKWFCLFFFSLLFFYPPFNKTWKQFYILQFFYTRSNYCSNYFEAAVNPNSTKMYMSRENSSSRLTIFSLARFARCLFFSPDTWKRFPGWLLASF